MIRPFLKTVAATTLALLAVACSTLPEGVRRAPADDPGAALLTLPSGVSVNVHPERLTYEGEARLRWPDGRLYDGEWVNGRPEGTGVEILPDGTRYRGEWQAGQRHGHGELTKPDGGRYVGDFAEGVRHGQGTRSGEGGTYRGSWSADLPDGRGVLEASDGSVYDGEWQAGRRFGYGRYQAPDGASYEGDWASDKPQGYGRLEAPDGASYDGAWQAGQRHGYGRAEGPPGLIYEGIWVQGEKHGFGRERRPDGSSYLGQWQAGKRHGQGLEVRADGWFHDGSWELNRALGPGQRRAPTGIEISGVWNGDHVASGLLRLPTGLEYAGRLFDGTPRRAARHLLSWLQSAAGRGDPYAQLMLGTFFLDMEQPRPDVEQARRWLHRSASAGVAEAQFRLALTWENVDPPRVVELLAEAGRQDHPLANETLGEYYYGGITVPRNLGRAIGYYQRAVDGGSVTARNNLAWLLATADQPQHRDGGRAVEVIRAIALYTRRWQYLDTLAAAWAAAGEFEKAVATARQAIEAAGAQAERAAGELADLEQRLAEYRHGRAHVAPAP